MTRRVLGGCCLALAASLLTGLGSPPSASFDHGPLFTVIEENDLVVRTDRHYTQGIKLSYLHREGAVPSWLDSVAGWIPDLGFSYVTPRVGLQIGQNIYTPADISQEDLIRKDRPYAGWLYFGPILQRRGVMAGRWLTLENFELQVGVIGPESLAEDAQTWVHEIRDIDVPQGWDNQINTEFGLALRYWRGIKGHFSGGTANYLDFAPYAGASLGNVETAARVGVRLRGGWNLPDDFGPQTINSYLTADGGWPTGAPPGRWFAYAFTAVEAWAVAHTVFLDGNLFQGSHHVSKETFVYEWQSGVAAGFRFLEVSASYVYRSREFHRQHEDNGYASISLKAQF